MTQMFSYYFLMGFGAVLLVLEIEDFALSLGPDL